ncbi:hypothetical protein ACFC4M_22115, partial [Streptomyces sp. NPDC056019]
DWSKGDQEKGDHDKGEHEKPKGGMHTGSGALSLVNADDWSKDKEAEKDNGSKSEKDNGYKPEKDNGYKPEKDNGYKPEKPSGGMHTGGGGLADTGTSVTGALVVAAGLAGFVIVRRRKASAQA